MNNADDFPISYWAGDQDYSYGSPKPKRSIKKKLAIVFSFILVLAITPSLVYALSNLDFSHTETVASTEAQAIQTVQKKEPVNLEVIVEEPQISENEAEVIANDSYWKISKRVCGNGKYYLSIQNQNDSKALHIGDKVTASCVL